ncbi:MAG: HEPN domain-containing protein [Pedosphaera sp.]|nr:HEPN domain-containing protein [Pedosphaera sp.]
MWSGFSRAALFYSAAGREETTAATAIWIYSSRWIRTPSRTNGVRPERTHDLGRLPSEYSTFDGYLRRLIEDCDKLTEFAVDIRYPDIPVEAEEQAGRQAAVLAERICVAIRARLPS